MTEDYVTCRCGGKDLRLYYREGGLRDSYCKGTLTDPGPVRVHKGPFLIFEDGKVIPNGYCPEHLGEKYTSHKEGCEWIEFVNKK